MKVYVECDRCKKRGAPEWRNGTQQLSNYSMGHHMPPSGWNVVAGYTLCGDCVGDVLAVVHKAVAAKAQP